MTSPGQLGLLQNAGQSVLNVGEQWVPMANVQTNGSAVIGHSDSEEGCFIGRIDRQLLIGYPG